MVLDGKSSSFPTLAPRSIQDIASIHSARPRGRQNSLVVGAPIISSQFEHQDWLAMFVECRGAIFFMGY